MYMLFEKTKNSKNDGYRLWVEEVIGYL